MLILKTENRVLPKTVKMVRDLFERNGLDVNPFEIKHNLRVVGWKIPPNVIDQNKLRKIILKEYEFLSQFQSPEGAYTDYHKDGSIVRLTLSSHFIVTVT